MELKKFAFEFTEAKKRYQATCTVCQPAPFNYHLYRVHVAVGKLDKVFLFYLIDEKERKFFAHRLNNSWDNMAISIEKALIEFKETKSSVTVVNDYKPFWLK